MTDSTPIPSDPNAENLLPGTTVIPESETVEYKSLKQKNGVLRNVDAILTFLDREDNDGKPGIKKVMNAMFNSSGGTIHLGVNEVTRDQVWKIEEGVELDQAAQDKIIAKVAFIFSHFHPGVSVNSGAYDVKFLPVSPDKMRIAIKIDRSSRIKTQYHFISDEKSVAYERIGSSCATVRSSIMAQHSTSDSCFNAAIDANLVSHIRSIYDVVYDYVYDYFKRPKLDEKLSEILQPVENYVTYDQPRLAVKRAMISSSERVLGLTRHGLSKKAIYHVTSCLDNLINTWRGESLGQLDEDSRYELAECYFTLAYEGIKYRKTSEIFQMGVCGLARIAGYRQSPEVGVEHIVPHARDRYLELFDTINVLYPEENPRRQKYTSYLRLMQEYYDLRARAQRPSRIGEIETQIFGMGMTYI